MRDANARPLHRAAAVLATALALAGWSLNAQELTGSLRLSDGRTPAPGVLVEAARPSDSRLLARVITGEDGNFVLRVPAGDFTLRALRIGYRPTDLGRHTLAEGERRRAEFTLADRPVVLTAMTTRASARCLTRDRAGETVATVFDEARKALLASQLSPPEGRPTARILLEQSVTEPDGRARVAPLRTVGTGFAARPFRSAPPTQLAALGYTLEERDGTTYFAPDANVLLSDQFAAQHCLRLANADPARPARVGIAFEPVERTRGPVRIRGTLWLDSATFGLERLDFAYVGLPGALDEAGLGGSIEFAHLPDGLWFEDRWEIRMPRLTITRPMNAGVISIDGAADVTRLTAIQRAGGRVLSIEREDRVLYASAGSEPELLAPTDARSFETAAMLVRAACGQELPDVPGPRSAVVGLVQERDARPVAGARVAASWQEEHRINSRDGITWRERTVSMTSETDGFFALCGLPRERRFPLQAVLADRRTPRTTLRFEAEVDHMRADLRFVSPP